MKWFRKIGAEAILTSMIAPIVLSLLAWFASFVYTTYQAVAEVSNIKDDLKEIKTDVKDVKKYLIERNTR